MPESDVVLERVKTRLADLSGLSVRPHTLNGASEADLGVDAVVSLGGAGAGSSSGPILITVANGTLGMDRIREAERQQRLVTALRGDDATVLLAAEWISPLAGSRLRAAEVSYLDLQGNASIRIPRPLIIIQTEGSRRAPAHLRRTGAGARSLAGDKALRLLRALIDVRPPYRAAQLPQVTQLSAPYVSRLLEVARDLGMVSRARGVITDVDWEALLRHRAALTPLLTPGRYSTYVDGATAEATARRLRDLVDRPVAVTGHVVARDLVPVALGGQLMIYVGRQGPDEDDTQARATVARQLRLLPKDRGGDVVLISASNDAALWGRTSVDGVPRVALSQLALDCLAGPGRLPAEGEALITRMQASDDWRLGTLDEWRDLAWGEISGGSRT